MAKCGHQRSCCAVLLGMNAVSLQSFGTKWGKCLVAVSMAEAVIEPISLGAFAHIGLLRASDLHGHWNT